MSNFTPPDNWTTWQSCDRPGDDVEEADIITQGNSRAEVTRREIRNINDTTRRLSSKRASEEPQYSHIPRRNPPQTFVHQMEAASDRPLRHGPGSRGPTAELSSTSLKRRQPRATQVC
jgi:hypothetical protein